MKQDEQQKNAGQPDDEPTKPSSVAAQFGIGRSIIAHEAAILREKNQSSTDAPLGVDGLWTNYCAGLVCRPFRPSRTR
jgi:hypothetical protein